MLAEQVSTEHSHLKWTQDGTSASTLGVLDDCKCHLGHFRSYTGRCWVHIGAILWGLGGYLGPPWGLQIKRMKTAYDVERCDGASTPYLFIKQCVFDRATMSVSSQHWNHVHGWNANIVLVLRLCSRKFVFEIQNGKMPKPSHTRLKVQLKSKHIMMIELLVPWIAQYLTQPALPNLKFRISFNPPHFYLSLKKASRKNIF